MSIECGECEHDLRGGHAENCSRRRGGDVVDAVFALLEPLSYDERQRILRSAVARWPSVPTADAELARLTPSGQVAEDRNIVAMELGSHPSQAKAQAAAARLAAQAQGYEVMKVERDAAVAESSTHLEWMKEERTRAEQAEKERDAAIARAEEAEKQARLAWERHAEKDKAYGGMIAQRDAVEAAVVETVGGKVEGAPVSRINYLQRLRELVIIEQAFVALSRLRAGDAAEQARQSETIKALEGALTTIAERGVSSTDRRIARDALRLAGRLR